MPGFAISGIIMVKKIKRAGTFFVYIVECSNGAYYAGYTNDLERRIEEHNGGKRGAKYTRARRPVVLVWSKEYKYFKKAVSMEARIKNLTRMQ
ncbi:MAG: GIY-YIG nuclease family protein, partial [Candidatus Omnitrophota bacterium]